jgi:hypothetical protein
MLISELLTVVLQLSKLHTVALQQCLLVHPSLRIIATNSSSNSSSSKRSLQQWESTYEALQEQMYMLSSIEQ